MRLSTSTDANSCDTHTIGLDYQMRIQTTCGAHELQAYAADFTRVVAL